VTVSITPDGSVVLRLGGKEAVAVVLPAPLWKQLAEDARWFEQLRLSWRRSK
jgi:hypothetical protein